MVERVFFRSVEEANIKFADEAHKATGISIIVLPYLSYKHGRKMLERVIHSRLFPITEFPRGSLVIVNLI